MADFSPPKDIVIDSLSSVTDDGILKALNSAYFQGRGYVQNTDAYGDLISPCSCCGAVVTTKLPKVAGTDLPTKLVKGMFINVTPNTHLNIEDHVDYDFENNSTLHFVNVEGLPFFLEYVYREQQA